MNIRLKNHSARSALKRNSIYAAFLFLAAFVSNLAFATGFNFTFNFNADVVSSLNDHPYGNSEFVTIHKFENGTIAPSSICNRTVFSDGTLSVFNCSYQDFTDAGVYSSSANRFNYNKTVNLIAVVHSANYNGTSQSIPVLQNGFYKVGYTFSVNFIGWRPNSSNSVGHATNIDSGCYSDYCFRNLAIKARPDNPVFPLNAAGLGVINTNLEAASLKISFSTPTHELIEKHLLSVTSPVQQTFIVERGSEVEVQFGGHPSYALNYKGITVHGGTMTSYYGAASYTEPMPILPDYASASTPAYNQIGSATRWQKLKQFLASFTPTPPTTSPSNDLWYFNWYNLGFIWMHAVDPSNNSNFWMYTTPDSKFYEWTSLANVESENTLIEDFTSDIPDLFHHHRWMVSPIDDTVPNTIDFYAVDLDEKYLFSPPIDGNYSTNLAGFNEKWIRLRNPDTGLSSWGFIEPNGAIYLSLNNPNKTATPDSKLVVVTEPRHYTNISNLVLAQENQFKKSYDFIADPCQSPYCAGSGIKWIAANEWRKVPTSSIFETTRFWYYILADGSVYLWNGSAGVDADMLIDTLPTAVYDDPSVLLP